MGCCPSKSRAERDACCNGDSGEKQGATAAVAAAESSVGAGEDNRGRGIAVQEPHIINQHDTTPATLLMDRGDGALLCKSDGDPTPSSPPSAATLSAIVFSGVVGHEDRAKANERDINLVEAVVPRAAELTAGPPMTPSPSRVLQTSPRKAPVNYEDMPISSMYHRIHTVEAEAQDSQRQEELRAEAERREREVREFKASMLAPP